MPFKINFPVLFVALFTALFWTGVALLFSSCSSIQSSFGVSYTDENGNEIHYEASETPPCMISQK